MVKRERFTEKLLSIQSLFEHENAENPGKNRNPPQ